MQYYYRSVPYNNRYIEAESIILPESGVELIIPASAEPLQFAGVRPFYRIMEVPCFILRGAVSRGLASLFYLFNIFNNSSIHTGELFRK